MEIYFHYSVKQEVTLDKPVHGVLFLQITGITLERVRRVHPHPQFSDHGCAAPVLK